MEQTKMKINPLYILAGVVAVCILICILASCAELDTVATTNPGEDAPPVLSDEAETTKDVVESVGGVAAPYTGGISGIVALALTNLATLAITINRQLIVSKQKRILASVDKNPNTPPLLDQVNPRDILT